MGVTLCKVAVHLLHRAEQAVELIPVVLRPLGNLTDLCRHALSQAGDVFQALACLLYGIDAEVQVTGQLLYLLNYGSGLLLNISHHLPYFLGGAGGAPGKAANLIGDHGKTAAVLTRSRCLDRSIQSQQVGLAGNRLDHLGDALDVLAALAQRTNQFLTGIGALAKLVHATDGLLHHRKALVAALSHL